MLICIVCVFHANILKFLPDFKGRDDLKAVICADVLLGSVCIENLGGARLQKWMTARNEKFAELIDRATQNNVSYVLLVGDLLGQNRVPESVIDTFFKAVQTETRIHVIALLSDDALERLNYRSDIPRNLHLISKTKRLDYSDDNISVSNVNAETLVQFSNKMQFVIKRDDSGKYIISVLEKEIVVPSFEPISFDDARDKTFGFGVLSSSGSFESVDFSNYRFRDISITLFSTDDKAEFIRKIEKALKSIERSSFLRVTFLGRTAFGFSIDTDAVNAYICKRVFYAEVYDNTVMDISEEDFVTDISLRSEFVRLALADETLSESERSRVICCGWNVLNGKEVSAE